MWMKSMGERLECKSQTKRRQACRFGLFALTVALALGLIFTVGAPGPVSAAGGASKTLTGTWHITAPFFGPDSHAMATFFKEGTVIRTSSSKNNVNAHGIWEKTSPNTFHEQNREYVYQDEELALFADTTAVLELSTDGLSFVSEVVTVLKLLDGTVIDTVSFTEFGVRMVMDH